MSVSVHVSNIDREAKSLIIEAFDSKNRRIFKSPMKYKLETRKHVESVLRKELKVFDKPIGGGFHIVYHCQMELPKEVKA